MDGVLWPLDELLAEGRDEGPKARGTQPGPDLDLQPHTTIGDKEHIAHILGHMECRSQYQGYSTRSDGTAWRVLLLRAH